MNTRLVTLPKTFAEIDAQFPDSALRDHMKGSALLGSVRTRRYALTASGHAGVDAVERVLQAEWTERGYAGFHVGPSGPEPDAQIVAYLDQPYPHLT